MRATWEVFFPFHVFHFDSNYYFSRPHQSVGTPGLDFLIFLGRVMGASIVSDLNCRIEQAHSFRLVFLIVFGNRGRILLPLLLTRMRRSIDCGVLRESTCSWGLSHQFIVTK
jgi:hypothetical protein